MDFAKLKEHGPLNLLTATVWGEARGECLDGKFAVALVISNRVKDPRWPKEYEDVILQPKQFSCWLESDSNYPECVTILSATASHPDPIWRECRCAACAILGNWIRDITAGANHYHAVGIIPYWAKDQKATVIIGKHLFYKL